jgi:hypothetical protein
MSSKATLVFAIPSMTANKCNFLSEHGKKYSDDSIRDEDDGQESVLYVWVEIKLQDDQEQPDLETGSAAQHNPSIQIGCRLIQGQN